MDITSKAVLMIVERWCICCDLCLNTFPKESLETESELSNKGTIDTSADCLRLQTLCQDQFKRNSSVQPAELYFPKTKDPM